MLNSVKDIFVLCAAVFSVNNTFHLIFLHFRLLKGGSRGVSEVSGNPLMISDSTLLLVSHSVS